MTAAEAVIWARANRAAQMVVEFTPVQTPVWPLTQRPGPTVGPADVTPTRVGIGGGQPSHLGIDATVSVAHASPDREATRTSCPRRLTV